VLSMTTASCAMTIMVLAAGASVIQVARTLLSLLRCADSTTAGAQRACGIRSSRVIMVSESYLCACAISKDIIGMYRQADKVTTRICQGMPL
jgi:hypothetical protein